MTSPSLSVLFFLVVFLFDPLTLKTVARVCRRASCFYLRGLGSLVLAVMSISSFAQEYVKEKLGEGADERPCTFVFHGGSGSSEEDIQMAVKVQQLLALLSSLPSDYTIPLLPGTLSPFGL